MFEFLLSLIFVMAFGWLFLWYSWPSQSRQNILLALLAFPAGLALTSSFYFFWMVITKGNSSLYPFAEATLITIVLAVLWFYHYGVQPPSFSKVFWCNNIPSWHLFTSLLLVIVAITYFAISFKLAHLNPWGYWDAWARINLKARHLFAGGEYWTWIFQGKKISHHDYPLLLQCSIARFWTWNGSINLTIPQTLSVLIGVWSLFTLYGLIAWLRSPFSALILCLAYLTYIPLQFWSAMQYSDILLACYLILACAMTVAITQYNEHFKNYAFLTGFFAGSAAWCKNEGIIFVTFLFLWLCLLSTIKKFSSIKKALLYFVLGVLSIGSSTIFLKLVFSVENDLLSRSKYFHDFLIDFSRHKIVLDTFFEFAKTYWNTLPLIILSIAFLLYNRPLIRITCLGPIICTIAMTLTYYIVFVTTPVDQFWHLGTTLDRLILHVWPTALLSLSVLFNNKHNLSPNQREIIDI